MATPTITGLALSATWAAWALQRGTALRPAIAETATPAFATAETSMLMAERVTWEMPRAQERGDGWLYDLFTPPGIFFDPAAQVFSVVPSPQARSLTPAAPRDFGLSVIAVAREPFRLQLVGYVGEGDNACGVFVNLRTTEHFLARRATRVDELGLVIREFTVTRNQDPGDPGAPRAILARALVEDDETNQAIALDSASVRPGEGLVAKVGFIGAPGTNQEVRENEVIEHLGHRYRVDRIQADPAEVTITRIGNGSDGFDSRTLRVASTSVEDVRREGAQ